MQDISRRMAETFLVSCWHMNEHESAAMWSLYSRSGDGMCIRSDYRRLRKCLPKCVPIGEVNYIDYAADGFSVQNAFNCIVHKRKSFEHERELRAVFWEMDGTPEAQPLKAKIEAAGLWIDVDLDSLIDSIHISPTAAPWLKEVIEGITRKYDLAVSVSQSTLADAPLY
jgi:hypothetical protein